jgi:NADPH:quinone reductase-like Zn-dependent oxidoreductase
MDLIFSGTLSPIISKVFPLEEAKEAEYFLSQGKQFGKILLEFV